MVRHRLTRDGQTQRIPPVHRKKNCAKSAHTKYSLASTFQMTKHPWTAKKRKSLPLRMHPQISRRLERSSLRKALSCLRITAPKCSGMVDIPETGKNSNLQTLRQPHQTRGHIRKNQNPDRIRASLVANGTDISSLQHKP